VRLAVQKYQPKEAAAAAAATEAAASSGAGGGGGDESDGGAGGSFTGMDSVAGAVSKLLAGVVANTHEADDAEGWRWARLYNEPCDLALRCRKAEADALYALFSGDCSQPGAPRRMSPPQFLALLEGACVVDDLFPVKQVRGGAGRGGAGRFRD
jgi:hypothetical protein